MRVRMYEPEDYATIKAWAADGWDTEYNQDFFPTIGFVVDGIAAIFLYQTDSKVCFLENMISNPEACPIQKDVALDLLLKEAFSLAKDLGYRVAYATTNNPKVITRAIKHGVEIEIKHTLLTKNLTTHQEK